MLPPIMAKISPSVKTLDFGVEDEADDAIEEFVIDLMVMVVNDILSDAEERTCNPPKFYHINNDVWGKNRSRVSAC